jgi:hypothetical protein
MILEERTMRKSSVFLSLAVLMLVGLASGVAVAQPPVGDASVYFVTYFSNNVVGAPDATVRIVHDGVTQANLFAAYYVFDDSQELVECCACMVTADGINSESVRNNLTANPLTSKIPTRGVIKVISSGSANPAAVTPTVGLHGWATHIQATSHNSTGIAPWFVTETPLADANLGAAEQTLLQNLCYYSTLLSGKPCTCIPEDSDF